jgi:acyl-CoA hydrolase/GNAT superfamily N-acetyltransferase
MSASSSTIPAPDWTVVYAAKLASPAQAIHCIPRGRRILIGSGAAEPTRLVDALCVHGDHLADNEIVHLMTLGPAPYVAPELAGRFRHTAFFIGANVREAVLDGRADFMPVFLSELPELIRSRRVRIDVALVQVSPPDRHGYVSLGVSVDVVRAAVDSASIVIAEVNPRMPRTLGNSFLHVDRIDRLVPVDTPLLEHEREPLGEVERAIGRHVATLVPDGATLQTGIGRLPDAVLAALTGHHELGIHTEMFSDGVMELARAGAITGRKKTLLPGKMVTSFVMGSRALYDWVDENPAIEMRASDFVNDPFVIARNDAMIAINSCLAVDLTGQVAADTLRGRFFSGIGGQVDFVRGAARSRGGKAIIALPSTAKDGQVSRIQAALDEGAGVVTSRGDVRYVVTEHGVADLWGKNIRERAMALIAIAAPDHRDDLLAAAKRRRYVFSDQVIPRAHPWVEERQAPLRGGGEVILRPVRVTDETALHDLFYRLSEETTYKRFLQIKNRHPHEELQRLVDVDDARSMAIVALAAGEVVALGRYDLDPATRLADVAFVVRDDWQGRGIGTALLARLTEAARAAGLAGFEADVLSSNRAMLHVFHASGLRFESSTDAGVVHLEARFAAGAPLALS